MKIISIVGYTKSGKTSLVELLADEFEKRGLKIAIIKSSHHELDKPDSDTGRFRKNGRTVVGFNNNETAIFYGEQKYLMDTLSLIKADLVIIEGAKTLAYFPRVLCLREESECSALDLGLAIATYGEHASAPLPNYKQAQISALADLIYKNAFSLAGLDCKACGEDSCASLARRIVAGVAKESECLSLNSNVQISINGHTLAVNNFTAKIIAKGIEGMLSSLKGYTQGKIEIKIN